MNQMPEGCNIIYYLLATTGVILWIGFCALFREVDQHGYAAVVSGITSIVLVFGNTGTETPEVTAWERVAMTFLGVFVYLVIDNTIFPSRINETLRNSTADVVVHVRMAVVACTTSLRTIFETVTESIEGLAKEDSVEILMPIGHMLSASNNRFIVKHDGISDRILVHVKKSIDTGKLNIVVEPTDKQLESQPDAKTINYSSGRTSSEKQQETFEKCRDILDHEVEVLNSTLKMKLKCRNEALKLSK